MTLTERLDAIESALLDVARMEFGDSPGHPFRGNQYSDGGGPSDPMDSQPLNPQAMQLLTKMDREKVAKITKEKGVGGYDERFRVTDQRTGQSTTHTSKMDAERRVDQLIRTPPAYRPGEKPGQGYGRNHSAAEHTIREQLKRMQAEARAGA